MFIKKKKKKKKRIRDKRKKDRIAGSMGRADLGVVVEEEKGYPRRVL